MNILNPVTPRTQSSFEDTSQVCSCDDFPETVVTKENIKKFVEACLIPVYQNDKIINAVTTMIHEKWQEVDEV